MLVAKNISFLIAHTIGQHIEELYGQVFLPLYIVASLLPFLVIGFMIQPASRLKEQVILFIISLLFGLSFPLLFDIWIWNFLASKGIMLLGGLLVFSGTLLSMKANYVLLFLLGISLGMERGKEILYSNEWTWFFVSLLLVGILTSIFIAKFNRISLEKNKNARLLLGFAFFICGLVLILLL